MPYSVSQKNASRKYNENNYKRINMYLKPDEKKEWEDTAKSNGISLSEFVKKCVNEKISKAVEE